jgi:V/A-type H+-transporting ATPase subunit F
MARLTMVAPPDLATGFRLAGTDVVTVGSAEEAAAVLERLTVDPEVAVIGVHAPLLDDIEPALRLRLEDLVAPVVVAVPGGGAGIAAGEHRARLASLLQRAIGFRISFGEEEGP